MNTQWDSIEIQRVHRLENSGNLKAFVDVKLFGQIVIKGLCVMDGKGGLFVTMPRRASKEGKWFDMALILEENLRQKLNDKVLEAYDAKEESVKASS